MKSETAIIGAGTAGLLLAANLAKRGISVSVYDKKKRPGYPPVASGILSIKGLNSLGIPYKNAIRNTLYGARLHAGSVLLSVYSKEPKAYVLDRPILNGICLDLAEQNGANVELGRQVPAYELGEMSKRSIIVGADGALSLVARHFGMGFVKRYVLTYKAEFEVSPKDSFVDLFFDNSVSPGFFSWLCPVSKYAVEAGIGIESSYGNAKRAFDRFMAKYAKQVLGEARPVSEYASIIPIESKKKLVDEKKEVLLVGDAAGQVKASTGGGIIFGGNAALMASKAIYEHITKGAPLSAYEKAFKKRFGADMLIHKLIHSIYSSLSPRSMSLLIGALGKLGFGSLLSKYGDMDSPTAFFKNLLLRK
ncbi:MAG: FAD-dependent monooxygenase [Candidatus Micrarchaeia archaeon]